LRSWVLVLAYRTGSLHQAAEDIGSQSSRKLCHDLTKEAAKDNVVFRSAMLREGPRLLL
jgi:hypothetical protein